MSHKKPVPDAKSKHRTPTLLIRTMDCASNHHADCYHYAFSDHRVFCCCCSCHRTKQMDLNLVA